MIATPATGYIEYRKAVEELRSDPALVQLLSGGTGFCGSAAINGVGNDIDIAVCVDDLEGAAQLLEERGFSISSAQMYRAVNSDGWFSAKRGDINLLISEDDVFELWMIATRVCQTWLRTYRA